MKPGTRSNLILFCLSLSLLCLPGFRPAAQADNRRDRAEEAIKAGERLEAQNDNAGAIRAFQQGLLTGRALGDQLLISRSLLRMARVHLGRAETGKALSLAEEGLLAARFSGDLRQQAQALTEVGNARFYLDDPLRALEYFESSLQIMRQVGDRCGEANSLKDIGITTRTLGRYDDSLETLNAALEIFREIDSPGEICSVLGSIGTCYDFLGAYILAMDSYEQALKIARDNDLVSLKLATLTRLGYLCTNMSESERALEYFREADRIAEPLGVPREHAWVLMGLAGALSELGQIDAAIDTNLRSLEIYRQINSTSGISNSYRDLGHRYLYRDPKLAADYYRRALAIPHNPLTWSPYHGLARAHRLQGDLKGAIRYLETAIEIIESIRGTIAAEHHRTTFAGQYQAVYQELIEVLIEQHERDPQAGYDRRAYEIFERIKARAMLEAISQAQLDSTHEIEPDLSEREEQVNRRISDLQKLLAQNGLTTDERRRIIEELKQAERDYDGLSVEIKRRDPRYALRRNTGTLSLEDARQLLGARAAMVAYIMTEERMLAFTLTGSSFHVERLAASPVLVSARVENLIDLITRGEGWEEVSRCLYRDLVAPLEKHLSRDLDRLIIVPDGSLHYLPFETLIRDDRHGYMLEDYTISYAPSAAVLAQLKDPTETGPSRADLILFADPLIARVAENAPRPSAELTRALYEDEGLQVSPIPFSASEAVVVGRYAGPGSTVYTGKDASERRVKTDRLDRFRVIHFATHGLISQQRPSRSALVLAASQEDDEDGFLQAREIYNLKLASDLVVLSACQTAQGRVLAGEGIEGLARAFFYAGAKSVVASLWDVYDERTTRFMETFYNHLSKGRPKAEALRMAKLDMLKDRKTSAPRYWAPFILIGEGDFGVPISASPWWKLPDRWLLAAVLLALALSAVLLLRRKFTLHS